MDKPFLQQAPVFLNDKIILYRRFIGYYENDIFRRQEHYKILFDKKKFYYTHYYDYYDFIIILFAISDNFNLKLENNIIFFDNQSSIGNFELIMIKNHISYKYIILPLKNILIDWKHI